MSDAQFPSHSLKPNSGRKRKVTDGDDGGEQGSGQTSSVGAVQMVFPHNQQHGIGAPTTGIPIAAQVDWESAAPDQRYSQPVTGDMSIHPDMMCFMVKPEKGKEESAESGHVLVGLEGTPTLKVRASCNGFTQEFINTNAQFVGIAVNPPYSDASAHHDNLTLHLHGQRTIINTSVDKIYPWSLLGLRAPRPVIATNKSTKSKTVYGPAVKVKGMTDTVMQLETFALDPKDVSKTYNKYAREFLKTLDSNCVRDDAGGGEGDDGDVLHLDGGRRDAEAGGGGGAAAPPPAVTPYKTLSDDTQAEMKREGKAFGPELSLLMETTQIVASRITSSDIESKTMKTFAAMMDVMAAIRTISQLDMNDYRRDDQGKSNLATAFAKTYEKTNLAMGAEYNAIPRDAVRGGDGGDGGDADAAAAAAAPPMEDMDKCILEDFVLFLGKMTELGEITVKRHLDQASGRVLRGGETGKSIDVAFG